MGNHLTRDDFGAANGVPQLDADGLMVTDYLPQEVKDFLVAGAPTVPLPWLILPPWEFRVDDSSLAAGVQGQFLWIPPGYQFSTVGPLLKVDDFGISDLVVDFQINAPPLYSGPVSIYSGTKPKIPTGQTAAFSALPTTTTGDPGTYIRPILVSVPPPKVPNASPAAVVGTPSPLIVSSSNSQLFTVPSDGSPAITDTVLMIGHMPGPTAVPSVPADFALLAATNASSNASPPRSRLYVYAAQWRSGIVAQLNQSSASPFCGLCLRISHTDLASLVVDQVGYSPGDGVGAGSASTAAISSASGDSDLSLLIVGFQYQSSTADGWTGQVNSGGPASPSTLCNIVTSRGSTQSDIGLMVIKGNGTALGGSIAAAAVQSVGGTGGLLSETINSILLTIKRAPTQHGPAILTVQIALQQTT